MIKNLHKWLPGHIASQFKTQEKPKNDKAIHIVFCIVDHFEPGLNNASLQTMRARVAEWIEKYPCISDKHKDSDGKHPQHTFFYPAEQYEPDIMTSLASLCHRGYGEVEIHLHHDNDTPEGLRATLLDFKQKLRSHGLLGCDEKGNVTYGFIHGNWALNNSRKDGKWCGVDNELRILKETGCYADFTFPSAPSETQTRKINSIYYATDIPGRPKSHDSGIDVAAGQSVCGDLMLIQGPLTLNWRWRKFGIFPHIENGDISENNPPTMERIDLWVKKHIHVKGEPNWIFVKVHTHGCKDANRSMLLETWLDKMYSCLEERYNDGTNYLLHYCSAREMYEKIVEISKLTVT